jgi:hypothetical protein
VIQTRWPTPTSKLSWELFAVRVRQPSVELK